MTPGPDEATTTRPLALGDPLEELGADQRPESWGDRVESEPERAARYEAQRPPHHGD